MIRIVERNPKSIIAQWQMAFGSWRTLRLQILDALDAVPEWVWVFAATVVMFGLSLGIAYVALFERY